MNLLLPIASLLGIEVDELLDRVKKDAIAWVAVVLFLLVAFVFVLVGLNAWLTLMIGPIAAPLAIAAGAMVLALLIYAVVKIGDGIAQRRERERDRSAERTALVTTAAFTALPLVMQSDLMKKVGIPVGGALAAAFLLSKSGASRRRADD